MSTETATFAVVLRDETSGPAANAASALKDLKASIEADTKALRQMQGAMARLKGGQAGNTEAAKRLRDQITAQKASIAGAQRKFLEMGGTFEEVKAASEGAKLGFRDFLGAMGRAPGPIGSVAASLASLPGLALASAAGIAAIAAAMVAMTAAVIASTAALLRYGIAQSDARRSELLRLEGLTTIRRYHGLAAGSATELQSAIDRVSDSTAMGRSEVSGYAEQLYRMGLRGENLQQALEGVAITTSVQGEAMGRRFAGMAAGAIRTGGSVRRLADDVRARLGGVARRQMLALDVQSRRLSQGISRIFGDLRIEGFLSALNEMTSLFSQSTASGRALKTMVEAIFNPMLDTLERLGPVGRRFFQGMVIGALRLTIGLLRVRNWFRATFGDSELFSNVDSLNIALNAGIIIISGLVGVLATAAVVTGLLAVGLAAVAASVLIMAAPFLIAAAAIGGLVWVGMQVYDWYTTRDWAAVGTRITDGIVDGLRRGRDLVLQTVRSIANSAVSTIRDALGIRSPSRVFAALGAEIPRGFADGVERTTPTARGAVHDMVSIPADVAPRGGASAIAGQTDNRSISIGDIIVQVQSGDGREIGESVRDAIVHALEEALIGMGAPTT